MEKLTIKELEDYMKTPLTNLRGGKVFQMRMVNELLGYKKLEEEIGCPLEVRCRLVYNQTIYYKGNKKCSIHKVYEKGFTAYCWKENRIHEEYFDYNEYKKTWWLKADRSE